MNVRDDPRATADRLIEEHGLDGAIKLAMQKTVAESDNYAVSIWRDVNRLLQERKAEA